MRAARPTGGPGRGRRRPSTSRPSSTGCAASSRRPRRPTARPASAGREPQPGLALLRLAQGEIDAAAAAIRRVLDEASTTASRRSRLLAAYVEIMLAAGDIAAARAAADELAEIAGGLDAPLLRAVAAHATGAVLPRRGRRRAAALAALRGAWTAWQELEAPYEAARVRVLIGARLPGARRRRYRGDGAGRGALGLSGSSGAAPGRGPRGSAVSRGRAATPPGGLTAREVRGAPPRRDGQDQPGDRGVADPQREDGPPPPAATSSPSSGCRRAPAPPRTPTSTTWSDPPHGTNVPRPPPAQFGSNGRCRYRRFAAYATSSRCKLEKETHDG